MTSTTIIEIIGIVLLAACFVPIIRAELQGRGVRRHDIKEDES
jgi:hypothetical protein